MMLPVMLLLNILVPIWVVRRFCVSRAGVRVDHLLMFTAGYLFYWILPIGIGTARIFSTDPAMRFWYPAFDAVRPAVLGGYLGIALACYLSFTAGAVLGAAPRGRRRSEESVSYRRTFFFPRLLAFPLAAGMLAALVYTFLLRGELFHGYTNWDQTGEGVERRGPFIAWSLFLLALALIASTKRHEDSGFRASFGTVLRNPYVLCYGIVAVLALSLGGRLYFVSSLVILLAYRSLYFRPIPLRGVLAALAGLIGLSGLVGLTRLSADINAASVLVNVFSEPIFVSFSLLHFLGDGVFEWIKLPVFLLSSLVNLLPTVLAPDKADLILDPNNYGYTIFSPGGGLNSYFSLMINFGILGTLAFLFSFAWFLSYLRRTDRHLLFRVTYVMLTGWIGFTFFRDAFFISIVKTMFQFSVITPWAVVIGTQLVSIALRGRGPVNAPAAETAAR